MGAPIGVLPASAVDHNAINPAAVVEVGGELDSGVAGGKEQYGRQANQSGGADRRPQCR
jgi:hypothetical protein